MPKLSTVDTTAPGPTSATIVFPVDPNGAETKVWVEYGTTPSYGQMADPQTIPAGSPQTLTFPLTGLTPDTLYHVALFAAHTTDSGATHSQDLTFRTQKLKPIRVTVTARSVRATTKGKVSLPFNCGGNSLPVCKGTARLKLGKRAAGSAAFSVASGHRKLVPVKLAPFVWSRLRAGHAVVLTLTLAVQTGHGLASVDATDHRPAAARQLAAPPLVAEVAAAREDHRRACLGDRGDHVLVAA